MINNVHIFKHDFKKRNERFRILNVSDIHLDSKNCDRKLLKKHFDIIKECNGAIFINGDLLDVMGAKRDPRSVPNDIRPEYNQAGGSYLDLVIQDAYEFLKQYKENIYVIGYGNHETNIERRQQIDPLRYLVSLLNQSGANIQLGGYQGAIVWKFTLGNKNKRACRKWFYHHGSGGGAKRSKGVLNADILISQNGWADLITSGHDHNKFHLPFTLKNLNEKSYQWEKRRVDVLRTGSYKKKSINGGWEVEKDFNEPTLGGYFVDYYYTHSRNVNGNSEYKLQTQIVEAV